MYRFKESPKSNKRAFQIKNRAACVEQLPETLPKQLARPRRPRVTREISAAAFLP